MAVKPVGYAAANKLTPADDASGLSGLPAATGLTGQVPQANGGLGVDASALSNGVLVKSGGVMSSTTAPTMSGANISAGTIPTASLDAGTQNRLNPTPPAAGAVPYSNGTSYNAATAGTSSQLLHGGTTPSFGAVALASEVSGTLPASNGGTGNAIYAAGDLLYASGTTTLSRLATGTATQVLHGGTTPSYGAVSLTADVSGVLPVANGGTGSSAGTTSNVITGLTLFATPVSGEIGYESGNNTVSRAIATSLAAARAVGVYTGTANTLSRGPRVGILLEAGLNSGTPPAAGQPIFVSASVAGRGTNVAPSTATQVEAQVAILLDAAGYNNATGSVQDCAWQVTSPIQL